MNEATIATLLVVPVAKIGASPQNDPLVRHAQIDMKSTQKPGDIGIDSCNI